MPHQMPDGGLAIEHVADAGGPITAVRFVFHNTTSGELYRRNVPTAELGELCSEGPQIPAEMLADILQDVAPTAFESSYEEIRAMWRIVITPRRTTVARITIKRDEPSSDALDVLEERIRLQTARANRQDATIAEQKATIAEQNAAIVKLEEKLSTVSAVLSKKTAEIGYIINEVMKLLCVYHTAMIYNSSSPEFQHRAKIIQCLENLNK